MNEIETAVGQRPERRAAVLRAPGSRVLLPPSIPKDRRRPRILYLTSNDPRVPLTGAPLRVGAFVRFLSERFPVHLLYLEGAGRAPTGPLPPAKEIFPALASEHRVDFRKDRYFLYSPYVRNLARSLLQRYNADVVVCDYGVWGIYGRMLAREFGVPFVYSSHNIEWKACLTKAKEDPRRLPLSGYYLFAERQSVRHADLLVAISPSEARYFRHWRPVGPALVIPQGVNKSIFYAETPRRPMPGHRRVLFCGNMSIPFNREAINELARRVVPTVVARRPDVVFEVIGADPPAHSPHPAMHFTGFVDDYPARLRSCDAAIVPILHGFGFPTKTIEALACGRPTVATPTGVRGMTHGFPHLFVRKLDDFGSTLLGVLDHPDRFGAREAALVHEEYAWESILAPLESEIVKLATSRTRAVA